MSSTLTKTYSSLMLEYKIPLHKYNINNTKLVAKAISEMGKHAS
jgi:hypothetical protein